MSLWWARKDQLDPAQLRLIEQLPLRESCLVLGPPGCGKTNVLLRRAQFVRSQEMPNVLVLAFTRALTEFIKTGCLDPQKR
jgi:superfamily I DNA/RNA helicase